VADDPFRLWRRSDFPKLPAMRWAVKDLVVLGGVTLLFGAPKNGKSLVAVSIACAVTAGVPWCGFPTRKLKVLYVGAEGFFGLLRREAAWSKVHGVAIELQYFRTPINFFDIASVTDAPTALKQQGFVPDLIIIDTLARSMVGGDESATKDMSKVFDLIDRFRRELREPTFVLVHHGTKDGLTYRGSSVIAANIDGAIEVSKEGLTLKLSCPLGMKDAAEFATFKVRLEQMPVETEDGAELVPVVKDRLDWLDMTSEELGRNEELAFNVLAAASAGLTWSDWFKATKAAHGGKLGSSNFSDITKRLLKAGRVKGGGGKRGAVFQVVSGQAASPSTNAPPNTPHSRVKDPGVRSDSSGHSGITPGVKSEVTESCNEENLVVDGSKNLL
jgi:AAA domain-containing protein